ncbi:transposase [Streptomyces acidicola]|uniref:transposase n=1 Tax=Streptomyces acidicola TaxID=2596892 RepID=UPI0037F26EA5
MHEKPGRDAEPTAGVIDSQSIKADAVVGADSRDFDDGKLVDRRKQHSVADTLGRLLGVMVTAADVGDRTAAHHSLALTDVRPGARRRCMRPRAWRIARGQPYHGCPWT